VDPKAIAVLKEIGIDWSHSVPKTMNQVFTTIATHDVEAIGGNAAGGAAAGGGTTGGAHTIDMVVTLCSNDGVGCPFVRGHTVGQYVYRIFDDPSNRWHRRFGGIPPRPRRDSTVSLRIYWIPCVYVAGLC
jgi:hypothetical protein